MSSLRSLIPFTPAWNITSFIWQLYSSDLFFAKFYTVEKFMISHIAAQRDRLNINYITNSRMRMYTVTDRQTHGQL